jgi:tRNA nucleotidyltransferase (CCA-adding enzyme)
VTASSLHLPPPTSHLPPLVEMRLQPPPEVVKICRALEAAGHEAWCVGGAVRDAFLGIDTLDWDIATAARPEEVQKIFRRTVPVGLKFGTVGVLDSMGLLHEVTTFRHDVETDGRHAVVRFGASLEEDLARRDFTINAIAVHAERLEVRDPFGGREDLLAKRLRAVGDARERMKEDRLRALRALRFAGRFDFEIDPATWDAIRESAPHLGRLSMERVKQELEKVMEQVARPARTIERYREAGILAALIPSLAGAPAARFAALDHLARPGLKGRPQRRAIRLAALFVEPGQSPGRDFERNLKTLKFSNAETRDTLAWARALGAAAVSGAMGAAGAAAAPDPRSPAPVAIRRLIASAGRLNVPAIARLLAARTRAEGLTPPGALGLYRRALRIAWNDPLTVGELALDGDDLTRLGVPAGKAIGETLQALLDKVLDDPSLNTRPGLEALVKESRPR